MIAKDIRNVSVRGSFEQLWEFYNMLPSRWSNRDIVISARNKLSLSRATTYRYIKVLQDKGLVDIVSRGNRKLSNNEIVIDDMRKKNSFPSSNEEVGDRKTFVKKRR